MQEIALIASMQIGMTKIIMGGFTAMVPMEDIIVPVIEMVASIIKKIDSAKN